MKLAILVVYYFDDSILPMIRVHLEEIRKNTSVPYRIYASDTLLEPKHRAWLAEQPDIELVRTPILPDVGARKEHAHHLDHLRAFVRETDATHLVTLHPDSFPVMPGWAERLADELSKGAAFASASPFGYTGCLFWDRAFEETRPRLQIPDEEREGEEFKEFASVYEDDLYDSGIGFIFDAWRENRRWYALRQSHPALWGNTIVHLTGVSRKLVEKQKRVVVPAPVQMVKQFTRPASRLLPASARHLIYKSLEPLFVVPTNDDKAGTTQDKASQVKALMADPNKFLEAAGVAR